MMNKFNKFQILMPTLLALLLIITPLLSSSVRQAYLYFIINLLIIALGAEAGLLSVLSNPNPYQHHHHHQEDHNNKNNITNKHHSVIITPKPLVAATTTQQAAASTTATTDHQAAPKVVVVPTPRIVGKSVSAKVVGAVKVNRVKKCPSTPSLFFIGGCENDKPVAEEKVVEEYLYDHEEEHEDGEVGVLSGQELYTKAETFIGNFYKQLQMQREDSWKRIHGFCHKAF